MDFTYKFYPKHSLCTIEIHYHEHTSLPLLVHILSQMNSVQVTNEHTNNIFYVLLTLHLSIILGNDQLDTQLLYFTTSLL